MRMDFDTEKGGRLAGVIGELRLNKVSVPASAGRLHSVFSAY